MDAGQTSQGFRLGRTKQCDKCPWKVSTDPFDIPGYNAEQHRALVSTISQHHGLQRTKTMSCHEHPPGKEVACVGWLMNQLGAGNNIALRLRMRHCHNIGDVELDGEQHRRFEDTLPDEY